MWTERIILFLCAATLATAAPIKSDRPINDSELSIIDFEQSIFETASDSAIVDVEAETPPQFSRAESMLIPADLDQMKVRKLDKVKKRIRRGIFHVKCPAGQTKIGGVCMSCDETGTC